MNVAYVANETYARHLGVSLCSLCDNNAEEEELRLFVVSTGIGERSKERLRRIVGGFGQELTFLDLWNISSRFGGELDTGAFDVSTMGRLFLGELLPAEIEKVIYLDCDTVVLRPLRKLWQQPLQGAVLAAVQEPTIYPEVKAYLHLSVNDPYFNAGVLLMDLKLWREEQITRRVIEFYHSIERESLFHDQDALNGSLCGRIRSLAPKWNFFTNYRYFRYRSLCRMQPSYRKIPEKCFRKAKLEPSVLHYAGAERPWKAGALNYYGKEYDRYLEMTPWAGTKKEGGEELKMALYHGMQLITPILPFVREKLSRAYVKQLMRKRSSRMGGRK